MKREVYLRRGALLVKRDVYLRIGAPLVNREAYLGRVATLLKREFPIALIFSPSYVEKTAMAVCRFTV